MTNQTEVKIVISPVEIYNKNFRSRITVSINPELLTFPSEISILNECLYDCWGYVEDYSRVNTKLLSSSDPAKLEEQIQAVLKETKKAWADYKFYCQSQAPLPGERVITL
jgi:hypothetical protein